MRCPPFDVHICKFEMEQRLEACGIDVAAQHLRSEEIAFWSLSSS